jgi:hypothetical protein
VTHKDDLVVLLMLVAFMALYALVPVFVQSMYGF